MVDNVIWYNIIKHRGKRGTKLMTRNAILQAIQALPPEEQEELIGEVLARLPLLEEPISSPNSSRLAGIFSNGQPPPSDAQVAQWLNERRQEKYER